MKKLIFLNAILALALALSYCTKPDAIETADANQNPAFDRSTCTITNIAPVNTADLTFCGIAANGMGDPCMSCGGDKAFGSVTFPAGTPVSFNITSPSFFYLRASKATSVNLTAGSNNTGWLFIPAGGCRTYSVDENCVITAH